MLVVSVSVYAKTEAGLNVEGFAKKKLQQRGLAESTVNDMDAVLAQLGKMNKAPKGQAITTENMGFSGNTGALTKPQKKSAVQKTADSTKQ